MNRLTDFDGKPCPEFAPDELDGVCRRRLSIVEIRLDEQRVLYRCERGHAWDAAFVDGEPSLLHMKG
jgi:hypothetical protein